MHGTINIKISWHNNSRFNKRTSGSASQAVYSDANLHIITIESKLLQHLPMRTLQLMTCDMSSNLRDTRHASSVLRAVGFCRQYIRDANLYFWHTNPLNRTRLCGPRSPSKECWEGNKLDALYVDEISIN